MRRHKDRIPQPRPALPEMRAACRTEPPLLPVDVDEDKGVVHDAFAVPAVRETEKVSDLVGRFLDQPVDEVPVVCGKTIVLILQAGGRYDGTAGGFPREAEEVFIPAPAEIF